MTRSARSRGAGVLGKRVLLPPCLFGREPLLRFVGVADRPRKPFDKLCREVIALKIGGADPLAERYNLLLPVSGCHRSVTITCGILRFLFSRLS